MQTPLKRLKAGLFEKPWRTAFFVLLLLVFIALFSLYSWWASITTPHTSEPMAPPAAGQGVPVEATVPLDSINRFVDMQLKSKDTPVKDAQIRFEKQRIRTDTALVFFGRAMNLTMWMKPTILKNGDLSLVAEDVQVGNYPVPLKTLFAVLEGVPWPPWVHVQSEQYTLEFRLSERPDANRVLIKSIDWVKERIQVEIRVGVM